MSYLNTSDRITVGDVDYYIGHDPSPTFSAATGSIYINQGPSLSDHYKSIVKVIYLNRGDNIWEKCITESYGEVYSNETTERTSTQNQWGGLRSTNWTEGLTSSTFEMNNTNGDLVYTGDYPSKMSSTLNVNISHSPTGGTKFMIFQTGISFNFLIPLNSNKHTIYDDTYEDISTTNIYNLYTNDFFAAGLRWTDGTSNDYIPTHSHLTAYRIDSAIDIFSEDWDNSNDWIIVNDTTNIWGIGGAESNSIFGVDNGKSIYISNDGFTTATYDINTSQVSHFYKEFDIPIGNEVILSFDWKCWAEDAAGATNYDYGTVVIDDSIPVSGVESSTVLSTLDSLNRPTGNGRIGAITNSGKFNLVYGGANNNWKSEQIELTNYGGQTKKIIFTWKNDGSVGNDVPFVIDNIYLYVY